MRWGRTCKVVQSFSSVLGEVGGATDELKLCTTLPLPHRKKTGELVGSHLDRHDRSMFTCPVPGVGLLYSLVSDGLRRSGEASHGPPQFFVASGD